MGHRGTQFLLYFWGQLQGGNLSGKMLSWKNCLKKKVLFAPIFGDWYHLFSELCSLLCCLHKEQWKALALKSVG